MRNSLNALVRSTHVKTVDPSLPKPRTTKPKFDRDCQTPTTAVNDQPSSAILGLIEECFIRLDWKHEAVASLIDRDKALLSRALNERDGKVFDARWFDALGPEFLATFWRLLGERYGFSEVTKNELIALAIQRDMASIAAWINTHGEVSK